MKKIPITCRIFKAIGRKSPSGIFAGCKIGKIPGGGCVGCPEYEPFCEFIEKENPMEEKEIHCSCGKLLAKRHSDGKIYVWCKECRKEVELEVETDGFAKNHVSSRDGTCMSSVPSDCD